MVDSCTKIIIVLFVVLLIAIFLCLVMKNNKNILQIDKYKYPEQMESIRTQALTQTQAHNATPKSILKKKNISDINKYVQSILDSEDPNVDTNSDPNVGIDTFTDANTEADDLLSIDSMTMSATDNSGINNRNGNKQIKKQHNRSSSNNACHNKRNNNNRSNTNNNSDADSVSDSDADPFDNYDKLKNTEIFDVANGPSFGRFINDVDEKISCAKMKKCMFDNDDDDDDNADATDDTDNENNFIYKKNKMKKGSARKIEDMFDVDSYLPQQTMDGVFEDEPYPEPKRIKGNKFINPISRIGMITETSKNLSHDIRGDIPNPIVSVSPWNQSTIAPTNNFGGLCN
jgi:hypothetical protein